MEKQKKMEKAITKLNKTLEILENNKLISDYMGIKSKKVLFGWIIISANGTKLSNRTTWTEKQAWEEFLLNDIFHQDMNWLMPVIDNILEEQFHDETIRKDIYGLSFKHREVILSLQHGRILKESDTKLFQGTYSVIIQYLKKRGKKKI